MPWNVLPVLEEDGKQLSQSATIVRYLGRKFKLAGADEFQTAKCNEYVDAVTDLRLGKTYAKLFLFQFINVCYPSVTYKYTVYTIYFRGPKIQGGGE
jgi:hypothetical protein